MKKFSGPMQIANKKNKVARGVHFNGLTAAERLFVNAVAKGDIFVVYQPIVDNTLRVQGFELLVRWQRTDLVIYPGEFLPSLRNDYTWMVLTAFVLRNAIKMINRYDGKFYYSINIPNQLIHERGIVKMLESARSSIANQNYKNLVLEINEKTSFESHPEVTDNIKVIQDLGYRVFLDDCFSELSAFFPVRKLKFDGYKIDISAVRDSLHDFDCLALIQSLQYYCYLTKRKCIAEGIDSIEKIKSLRQLTNLEFQGSLISIPLSEEATVKFIEGISYTHKSLISLEE